MIYNIGIAEQVADFLLEIKAVILRPDNPFTWASGWRSPIYCDNRLILSHPEIRSYVATNLGAMVKEFYPASETIAGVATAGIPHAAIIADRLSLPMAYVRAKPKEHGTGKLIEGYIGEGQKVVVVEDLISTGKSSLQAVNAIKEAGAIVEGLIAVFSYGFQEAHDQFVHEKVSYCCLSNYEVLLKRALEKDYIKSHDLRLLEDWRRSPAHWH
jgi:orotate phosphoribosyltransferase